MECFRCWAQWRRTARGCRELLRRLLTNEAGLVVAAWRELTVEALQVGMENEHRAHRFRARRLARKARKCWVAWRQHSYMAWLAKDYSKHLSAKAVRRCLVRWHLWARACRRSEAGFRHQRRQHYRSLLERWRQRAAHKSAARVTSGPRRGCGRV